MNKGYSYLRKKWFRFYSLMLFIIFIFLAIPPAAISSNPVEQRCVILGPTNTACNNIGTIFNNGKGNGRSKNIGGNSLKIRLKELRKYYLINNRKKSNVEHWREAFLGFYKKTGNIKYIALHVRKKNGVWNLVYKGKPRNFQLAKFRKYWLKNSYTDIIISLNGAHERFEPIKAESDVFICVSARESVLVGLPPCNKQKRFRFLEQFSVSAMGQKIKSSTVTKKGFKYILVVTGIFQYDQGETGTKADAQHEENDEPRFVRYNWLSINGSTSNATKSNLPSHTYEFHITGTGAPLTLHIEDSNYSDNAGSLSVKLYGY